MFLTSNLLETEKQFNFPIDKKRHIFISGNKSSGKTTIFNESMTSSSVILEEICTLLHYVEEGIPYEPILPNFKSIKPFLYLKYNSRLGEAYYITANSDDGTDDFHIYDGCLFVVDCNDPIKPETERLLQLYCIDEHMKPILIINKIDTLFFNEDFTHVNDDYESIYLHLEGIINNMNALLAKNSIDFRFSPYDGTVIFSSSLFNFSFSTHYFALFYQEKFGISLVKLREMLWGEYYFNNNTKNIIFHEEKNEINQQDEQRTFCKFILYPIISAAKAVISHDSKQYIKIINVLHLNIPEELLDDSDPKALFSCIMNKWLSLRSSILESVILNIPSPKDAQLIRYKSLLSTYENESFTNCMKNCDPNAPPIIYIANVFPHIKRNLNRKFYAVGRIFSGTIHPHQCFKLISPSFEISDANDCLYRYLKPGIALEEFFVNPLQCGNIIYLTFPDDILMPNGLLVAPELIDLPFYPIKLINSLTNQCNTFITVKVENQQDYPRLVSSIHFLSRMSSQFCISYNEDELEITIKCYDDFNFNNLIHDLREEIIPSDINLIISEPQKV